MLSHVGHVDSRWGYKNPKHDKHSKEAASSSNATSSSTSNGNAPTKGGGKYSPADRCCTVCSIGLFLPRDMTDSGEEPVHNTAQRPKTEDEVHMDYARLKLKRFEDEVKFRHDGKTSDEIATPMPLLKMEEVKLGKKYGKGGSATVYEITGFALASTPPTTTEGTSLAPDEAAQQKTLRDHLMKGSFPQKDRYVLKKLSTKIQNSIHEPYGKACAINLVLEARILRMLDHPNILKLHAMGINEETQPFLVLTCLPESMEQRILYWRSLVKKHKKQLETSASSMWRLVSVGGSNKKVFAAHLKLRKLLWERMHVARDIGLAVEYLHSKDICYRDLKCSNLGFDASGVVKIFDFGISRMLPRTEEQPQKALDREAFVMSKAGTRMYMAPEIMAAQPYNFKADVYSYGVILWQLLSVTTPKPIRDAEEHPLFEFPMCPCWPQVTQELVAQLLEDDPRDRPTMKQAHQELTKQLDRLKRAFTQQDAVPVLTAHNKKKRGFGRAGTFELSTDLDMP